MSREVVEKYLGFNWDLKFLWITIFFTFLVTLFVIGICVIINTDKEFSHLTSEEKQNCDVRKELSDIKIGTIFILPPTLLIGYFFPVAFHLLRPGMANKIIGFVFISIFVVLSIIGFFLGLRFDEPNTRVSPSVFFPVAIFTSIPLVLYGLFLMCAIIFYVCCISIIEATIVNEERTKVESENSKNRNLKKIQ